jgi:hypothetical protein
VAAEIHRAQDLTLCGLSLIVLPEQPTSRAMARETD